MGGIICSGLPGGKKNRSRSRGRAREIGGADRNLDGVFKHGPQQTKKKKKK